MTSAGFPAISRLWTFDTYGLRKETTNLNSVPLYLSLVGIRTRNIAVLVRIRILYTTNRQNDTNWSVSYLYAINFFLIPVVPRHHIISDVLVYLEHGTKTKDFSDFAANLDRTTTTVKTTPLSPSLPLTQTQQAEYIKMLQKR